jgi:hypothetical protein
MIARCVDRGVSPLQGLPLLGRNPGRCPGLTCRAPLALGGGGKAIVSATSCALTDVSVKAPGQQVVRATHEMRAYWRDGFLPVRNASLSGTLDGRAGARPPKES